MNMIKAIIVSILSLFSSSLFSLDLTYDTPIDWDYCVNNKIECDKIAKAIEDDNIFPEFEIQERTTKRQWALFFTFQVLDVYSTSKAIKYDCITEINPLFTETPGDLRLVATKTLLLAPALLYNDGYKKITPDELDNSNMLYMFVVANNFRLLNEAKQNCNKIR